MQNSTWRLGALLIILTLLTAGCGQKGDLYKPERKQQPSSFNSQPAD